MAALAVASAVLPWWSARAASAAEDALAAPRPPTPPWRARPTRGPPTRSSLAPLLTARAGVTDLGQPARALGAYRAATDLQPDNPEAWRALAIFLGDGPGARAAWEQVHRLDPRDPEAALRAG